MKSLKSTGRAIIVMSQGVLFRGQPEQTEAEDGRNQKADAEYVIRNGFIKADVIESVIVLPSKLFYGNSVPGCLIVLNKHKPQERKNKILLVWASRNYESNNPQNILRRADCLRILVAWRAFGDIAKCRELVPIHEADLLADIENGRDSALADIEEAYKPFLDSLVTLRAEFADRQKFSEKEPPTVKEERKKFRDEKKENAERLKVLKRDIKVLEKLEAEAEEKRKSIRFSAERESTLVKATAVDMLRICQTQQDAGRYFAVASLKEIEENEFNLNLPRYIATFEPEPKISIACALNALNEAERASTDAANKLRTQLAELSGIEQ